MLPINLVHSKHMFLKKVWTNVCRSQIELRIECSKELVNHTPAIIEVSVLCLVIYCTFSVNTRQLSWATVTLLNIYITVMYCLGNISVNNHISYCFTVSCYNYFSKKTYLQISNNKDNFIDIPFLSFNEKNTKMELWTINNKMHVLLILIFLLPWHKLSKN